MTNFTSVKKFMEIFGQEVKAKAEFPSDKIVKLRYNLIKEELDEFEKALKDKNLKEVADALADILYVTYGAGHAFGIDLDKCFDEVQRSNMSKLDEDGKPHYEGQIDNGYRVGKGVEWDKDGHKRYEGEWRRIHKYAGSRLFTGKVYYFYGGTDTLKLQGEYLEGRLISGQNFDRTGQKY